MASNAGLTPLGVGELSNQIGFDWVARDEALEEGKLYIEEMSLPAEVYGTWERRR
jgi:hypothetical protein